LNLTAKDGFEPGRIAASHLTLIESRIAHLQKKIEIQAEHAQILLDTLAPGDFCLPVEADGCQSNWYQFALRFQSEEQRDAMAEHLLGHGIDTARYLMNIEEEACLHYGYTGDCPNAERLSKTILLVPIHYTLHRHDIDHIAAAINAGSHVPVDTKAAVLSRTTP
jgi:dTDP-4-amino-4,6-dideoxygalactose transaminase